MPGVCSTGSRKPRRAAASRRNIAPGSKRVDMPVKASDEKAFCFDYLERNAKAIATLNDSIFYFAELGMQEIETAGLMCDLLETAGFKVTRGISGFASGFCATCGSGAPVIAIHTEYDANPDNSQASGVAQPQAIVE